METLNDYYTLQVKNEIPDQLSNKVKHIVYPSVDLKWQSNNNC